MFYELYKDKNAQWRWTLWSSNGRKLANCGEGYHNKADCLRDLSLVKGSATAAIRERKEEEALGSILSRALGAKTILS